MTGYLSRLAARSTNATTGLRPRAPSMFEAAAPVGLEPFGLGAADAPDVPAAPSRPRPPEVGTSPRQMEPPERAVQPAVADRPAAPSTSRRRPSPVDEWAAPADHTGAERAVAASRPATQFGAASPAAPSWERSSTPDNPHDLSAQKAPPVPPADPAAKSLLPPAQHPRR